VVAGPREVNPFTCMVVSRSLGLVLGLILRLAARRKHEISRMGNQQRIRSFRCQHSQLWTRLRENARICVLLFLIELQGENATEISMIEKLALYIWDNYVDFHETLDKVVFMGIGTAMHFVHAIL
jgi:hypothetical protein